MWTFAMLAATAHSQDFICNGEVRAIGVAPIEVTCEAVLDEKAHQVEWLNGLGDSFEGEQFTSEYAQPGFYSVSMYLEGYGEDGESLQIRRDGAVIVCGVPDPRFEIVDKGGRTYQARNTMVADPLCIDTIVWEIRAGDTDRGEVLQTFESWEPRFTLEEDGFYTVTLTATGRAGVATSSELLDAEYGLTEEYYEHYASGCSSTGPTSAAWWLLGLVALVRRRQA